MAHEPEDLGPYSNESTKNTSTAWLDDFKPVEAKLDGMVDYAKALNTIHMNLLGHRTRIIEQISALMTPAFVGGFPEVSYASQLHTQNFSEFNQYLQNLCDGIDHTANAAKAIADSYGEQDGFSAITLNAIQFAFADPDATRPSGLPKQFGQTFSEQQAAALADGKADKTRPAPIWVSTGTTMNADGGMTQTYKDQYGEVQTIVISYDADGHQITTTKGPSGTTTSDSVTTTNPFGSYTTTTNTDAKGKVSTATTDTNDTGNVETTDEAQNGVEKTETVVTYNADGSQTTTVYAVSHGKRTTIETQTSIGQDNVVDNGAPDTPAADAIDQIQSSMPKTGPKTVILAPGKPGTDYSSSSGGTSA